MHEAIKWQINSINPFVLHAFYLWGGLADYVYSLYGIPEGAKQNVARHEVHLHSTNKLQDLCFKNGGIYIKLGQHIGQLVFLFKVAKLWQIFNALLVHGVIKRSCCPLWGANEKVSEDVMVEMVTMLLLLKISQHVCHYCHHLLEVHPFVNNLFIFLVKGFKAKIYIYLDD